jgi:hypothetical protein
MKHKFLVVLPYFEGDKAKASALLKSAADLEPLRNEGVDWLLLSRYDCAPDLAALKHALPKFHVMFAACKRRTRGHPVASNDMFLDAIDNAIKVSRRRGQWYDAILFLEPDCRLCGADWFNRVRGEWEDLKIAGCKALLPRSCRQESSPEVPVLISGDETFLTRVFRLPQHAAIKWPRMFSGAILDGVTFLSSALYVATPGDKKLPPAEYSVIHHQVDAGIPAPEITLELKQSCGASSGAEMA